MPNLVVVGSLNMDLVVRTPRLPHPGETIIGGKFAIFPGGKGANQAVAASRLDAQVAMVGAVGADDFGRQLRSGLADNKVLTGYVRSDANAATGTAIISVDDQGQNTIIVSPGTNALLSAEDVERAAPDISAAGAVIAQLEIPLATVVHALRSARSKNVLTVLNPAPAQSLGTEILGLVDILIPNETEASLMTGIAVNDWDSAKSAARELFSRGAHVIVITLGALGALMFDGKNYCPVPAFSVKTVDTTAAGDAFVAALTVARTQGLDWERALQQANAAGALTAMKFGAQPSLPTRKELDEFLAGRNS